MNNYVIEYYDATGYASFFECVARSLDNAAAICERDNPGCIVTKVTMQPPYLSHEAVPDDGAW